MTCRIRAILEYILSKKHHRFRQENMADLAEEFSQKGLTPIQRMSERLVRVLAQEKPVILEDERIVFLRTVPRLPEIFTKCEWETIKNNNFIHELGYVSNICPDYVSTIRSGLEERRLEALDSLRRCKLNGDIEGQDFLEAVIKTIDAVESLTDRYREEAERMGNHEIADMLGHIPRYGARNFHEALQFFRILHFTLWCEGEYHNTIGRFDQYMYPYLKADIDAGRLDYDSAFELLLEFFISFNKDSDLYPGVQQGDNGQSMVLGGVDQDGNDAFNLLSEMCIKASKELKLIDPKINLRVHKDTKLEVYELATELTKEGLGFPQYSNDDVVIPGLLKKGYSLKDARNYVVAACWEFIIPRYGMDIPNIGALSFPAVVDRCLHEKFEGCGNFEEFMNCIKAGIHEECNQITENIRNLWIMPAPFMSILMDECIKNGKDISKGAKYNNFGLHGTGLANAADSLAAIKKYVFDEQSIDPEILVEAVDSDFEGYDELAAKLRFEAPKMGNDDDYVDGIAVELLETFADALENRKNERGGCYRAGTGSAMYYLWHAREIGASPDGRRKGEAFGANYSPSLFAKTKGPLSVIRSFTKPNLERVINGGPLTMEFHSPLFRDRESIRKVAMLVKSFIDFGGHQLQLNAVNREALLDAQKHPENYRNLIVRVWGWSAYFVELDKEYQDHVIKRQEYIC
ncbi:MAG: pyruvate formate-lyase [Firmicutes bacterium]|nr:pyruvate formate-lyase [Bacillota bacterium]